MRWGRPSFELTVRPCKAELAWCGKGKRKRAREVSPDIDIALHPVIPCVDVLHPESKQQTTPAAPRDAPEQVPGGRAFGYPKQLDRARRNLKPTSRPISECARSRPNPFLDECNAIALQPNLQSEPRSCGSESNCAPSPSRATPPRLALTPRTRRMQRCGRPSKTPTTSAASACSA